uniref:Uncharacterized protein n=1 Tax=Rhizophora mucronata TaxID=61149 RepID=A0A2P2QSC5_RHIMU
MPLSISITASVSCLFLCFENGGHAGGR